MSSLKPSQIVKDVYFDTIKISQLAGVNLPTEPEMNRRVILFLIVQMNCGIMLLNGFVQLKPNFEQFCQLSIFLNLLCQLIGRGINRFWFNDEVLSKKLQGKVINFYEKYEENYRGLLYKRILSIQRVMKIFIYSYILVFYIPVLICWIMFFVTGNFVTIVPFPYPFTNYDTLPGYLFNMIIITFLIATIIIPLSALANHMAFYGVQVIPMVDVLCIKLNELKLKIKSEKGAIGNIPRPKVSTSFREEKRFKQLVTQAFIDMNTKVHVGLLEIIDYINAYNNYVNDLLDLMSFVSFIAITTNAFALGLTIICILTYSVAVGLGLFLIYFCDILVPCVVGTIIAHQNERILSEIWSFPWHELSQSDQKIFLQLIHFCQNLNDLELPMFGHVDMELLKDIILTAYSHFTYILNFVKIDVKI